MMERTGILLEHNYISIGSYRYPVVISEWATIEKKIDRTWRDRLFSRPWQPLKKMKIEKEPAMYMVNDSQMSFMTGQDYFVIHPSLKIEVDKVGDMAEEYVIRYVRK